VKKTKISVVAPFYNEGAGVDLYFARMRQLRAELPEIDIELVCVDDGSRDDTLLRLVQASRDIASVRVVELSRNFGKEAALTAGIDAASGDAVIPIDADLQDPPDLIPEMILRWKGGAEVVLARRVDRSSDGYLKRTTAALFYRVHNKLSKVRIPENVGDFRLMDRCVVDALSKLPERQRFMKGLFAWVGFRTEVVEYVRPERAMGETKFSGFKLWELALEGITSFSTAPLKVWTYVGAIGAALTGVYAIFIILRTLLIGVDVPGYASLLVAVLFVGSLQLISVGLLGEYIGRIYLESKQRPVYLVRQIHESAIDRASHSSAREGMT
jgi:glycosyltransferase involved in cell wall biosynthesis